MRLPTLPSRNFNPRSPCGERPQMYYEALARGDFNPRSPCGERLAIIVTTALVNKFQSTLPVWGATLGNNG